MSVRVQRNYFVGLHTLFPLLPWILNFMKRSEKYSSCKKKVLESSCKVLHWTTHYFVFFLHWTTHILGRDERVLSERVAAFHSLRSLHIPLLRTNERGNWGYNTGSDW